jgi:C4-dicarboxylate transporter, DctM subunit
MEEVTLLAGILIAFLALFGLPLFGVLAIVSFLCLHFVAGLSLSLLVGEMYRLASIPVLIAIPLFTFAGYILAESRAPARLVNLSQAFLGWMPGGLSIVAILSCAVFTALTGASGVTIIAMGGLLLPALLDEGYRERFNLGLLTSSGSLGLLFPPSLPVILYAIISTQDVNKLFQAAAVPGILLVLILSGFCVVNAVRMKIPRRVPSGSDRRKALRDAVWELPLPFVILGGIYGGLFTASEAAAITAFYVLVVEVFIYRDVSLSQLRKIMIESMVLVGGLIIILSTALGFTNFLIDQQIPMKILEWIQTFVQSRIAFLLLLNVFLLIVGCLMDIFSAIVVVVPLIVPIAASFGVHPLHLGVIFLTNLEIGYNTPPVGINLFISSFRFKKPVVQLYAATLPFLLLYMAALALITYLPDLSLFLVRWLEG